MHDIHVHRIAKLFVRDFVFLVHDKIIWERL
jgi:hypothetical protein